MKLHQLVYVSSAVRPVTAEDVARLLRGARKRNAIEGVTGLLLHSEGNFIQLLEGPKASVEKVFEFVKADPLHNGIIELLNEPCEAREFAGWSMGFRNAMGNAAIRGHFEEAVLAGHMERPGAGHSRALVLLNGFWDRERGAGIV